MEGNGGSWVCVLEWETAGLVVKFNNSFFIIIHFIINIPTVRRVS